ncbi:hypothetical protein J6590_031064 [Homalodisca vitripennis]|nr:hypothetical protein J6590_031064 [Homalodisca vitripennis]
MKVLNIEHGRRCTVLRQRRDQSSLEAQRRTLSGQSYTHAPHSGLLEYAAAPRRSARRPPVMTVSDRAAR